MTGEGDLDTILASLRIRRRDEAVTLVSVSDSVAPGPGIEVLEALAGCAQPRAW